MKTYCLTCSQLPWKTEAAANVFANAGIDVEFFLGVHGATAGIAPTLSHFDSPTHFLNPGKLSITISKMLLWTKILEKSYDPVLLLENDIVLCDDFANEFLQSKSKLPSNWDVVHVGHCCIDKPTERINERVSKVRYPLCCHAVMWRREALQLALDTLKRCGWNSPSDIILARLVYPKLNHYTFTPALVFPDNTTSEAATTGRWDTIQGWFDYARLYDDALRGSEDGIFVEVGSWLGRSTAYMAEEIKRQLKGIKFYAVDTWRGSANEPDMAAIVNAHCGDLFPAWQRNMSRAGVIDFVTPIRKPSVEAAKDFADGSLRFIMIDGDHSFDSVVADIRAWKPKLASGGMLAGHDIDRAEVRMAVNQEIQRYRTWDRCWIVD